MADKKPPALSTEQEYFHKIEAERLARRTAAASAEKTAESENAARAIAIGRCPKDGAKLNQIVYQKVTLDQCPECQGIWLDQGEGRAILEAEKKAGKGFFTDFINSVTTGKKKEQSPL